MKEKDLNNEDEILTGQSGIDNVNLTSEGEVWNKEAALKENLTEQLGRTNKRIKANLNRIRDELGLDKINSVIAELIEIYEKRPPENNGIDIAADLIALDKSKKAIENIINSINTKTSIFEKEVRGSAAHTQQQIDLTIKSFMDTLNEINDKFEESIKEQEEINSSLRSELEEAMKEIKAQENVSDELNKELANKEQEIEVLKSEKMRIEAEAANAIQDIASLKNRINNLHEAEEENKKLKEKIRGLEHSLSLKDSSINDLEERNKSLTKDNESLKTELDVVKEEKRDLILKHKEEIIDIKEKIKEEAEKKYEEKIDKLKDEIYDLKKELESSKNNKGKN